MHIVILTPIRILGDGLAACMTGRPPIESVTVANDLAHLRDELAANVVSAVLIDVTQGIELIDVRSIAVQYQATPLVALGLTEVPQEVIKCGRAGFTGYVARESTVDGLCTVLSDLVRGRVACSPEISGGMLKALFRGGEQTEASLADPNLTAREKEVLGLLGRGLSNKEIGKELCLSVATVKHHVHHILEKLGLARRADAMRRVMDFPWLARLGSTLGPNSQPRNT